MNNNENNNTQAKILNELKIGLDNDSNTNSNNDNNANNNRFINNLSNVNSTQLNFSNEETDENKQNKINDTLKPDNENSKSVNPLSEMNVEGTKLREQVVETHENQYVNAENKYNETSLNDLNVEGGYNKLETPTTPFSNDEQVRENIEYHEKKTVKLTVTQEMKIFIIIGIIMLIFIIIMPYIFDIVENIRFH